MWIDKEFPGAVGKYQETSDPSEAYNCIAWAAGCDSTWWSHLPGYKWPARRTSLVSSLIEVFAALGYEACDDGGLEVGYDKVAIYANRNGIWKHAARQLSDGRWASKLGPDEDIEHDTAECLNGKWYGSIYCYMRRAKDGQKPAS